LITKKIAAYGASVVVALIVGVALMATASAAYSVGDVSTTITASGQTQTLTTVEANSGSLATVVEGTYSIVTQPASGGSVAITTQGTAAAVSSLTTGAGGGANVAGVSTITVASTANFPSSGYFFIDDNADIADATAAPVGGLDATDEIVLCTGKAAAGTTLTGCTRGVGNTAPGAHADGAVVYPIQYSVIAVAPFDTGDGSMSLADASGFRATGGQVITIPAVFANSEAFAFTGKSGNSLTGTIVTVPAATLPAGTDVVQFGRVVDSAVVTITVDSGFAGSFTYEFAFDQVAGDSTSTVTVIGDLPVANDVEATVTATLPTPLPVIINIGGPDSSEPQGAPNTLTFASFPTKGLLSGPGGALPATVTCTNVTGSVAGEVRTNCAAQLIYTPLAGATGTDSFTYNFANGGETSNTATVTIILPGGTSTTPGAGFTTALVTGVNLTTYGGGTVAQLGTDAAAAGATSVSVTVGGSFVVYVVGAPDFVNVDFATNFSGGVPAGTVVLVLIQS
jgi:hypothetical protein